MVNDGGYHEPLIAFKNEEGRFEWMHFESVSEVSSTIMKSEEVRSFYQVCLCHLNGVTSNCSTSTE